MHTSEALPREADQRRRHGHHVAPADARDHEVPARDRPSAPGVRLGRRAAERGEQAPEDRIDEFTSLIPDAKTGDRISFTWRPGTGIEVALNGKARQHSGDDFARARFAVWLGPKPGDENLKRGMLGT